MHYIVIMGLVGYWMYMQFFNKKNNIVNVRLYELVDGEPYLINSDKYIRGRIKTMDKVEKLFLPKKFSDIPIQAPLASYYEPNTKGARIVNVVRTADNKFVYIKPRIDLKEEVKKVKIMDNNTSFWMVNEMKDAVQRNASPDKYAWLKANGIVLVAIVISFLIVVYTVNKVSDTTQDVVISLDGMSNAISDLPKNLLSSQDSIGTGNSDDPNAPVQRNGDG